jgi:hypothetical protein
VRDFFKFCLSIGLTTAMPATPATLALWLTHLGCPPRSLALSTIKGYLAAVLTFHVECGFDHPLRDCPPIVDRILSGIKRLSAASQPAAKPKLPITTDVLRSLRPQLSLNTFGDSLLWAVFWVATTGMLRISEFTTKNFTNDRPLLCSQLTATGIDGRPLNLFTSNNRSQDIHYLTLRLEVSKTDPQRTGVDIILASRNAIEAVCTHLVSRRLRQSTNIALSSPLFTEDGSTPITRNWLMSHLNRLLQLAGHDPSRYSSHSFRKGGAVSMQGSGIQDSVVRQQGRWKSDAFHLYLRHPSLDGLIATTANL